MANKQPTTRPKRPAAGLTKFDKPIAHESAPLPVWRAAFLAALATTGNITKAAAAAQISRARAYQVQGEDTDFAADWAEALEIACDGLEEEARKRAMGEYITYKFHPKTGRPLKHPVTGEPYFEHVASDALLTLLLKAHRPDKFKDRSLVEINQPPARPYDLSLLSPEQLAQLEALTRAATPPKLLEPQGK